MFAVGVGPDVFEDEMHNIASSGAQVFKVADFVSLQSIIKVLRDKICQGQCCEIQRGYTSCFRNQICIKREI